MATLFLNWMTCLENITPVIMRLLAAFSTRSAVSFVEFSSEPLQKLMSI
jgi:hypothetical protein